MKKLLSVLGIVFLSLQTFAQVNLSNGLVAYYPFNGNANDASGNGNNPSSNTATLTTDRFGNANSAYQFGSGKNMTIPNSSTLTFTGGFSFSVWVKLNSYTGIDGYSRTVSYGYHPIFTKNCDRGQLNTGFYSNATYLDSTVFNLNAGGVDVNSNPYIKVPSLVGKWAHLLFTYSNSNSKLYINGRFLTSKAGTIDFTSSNGNNLLLGAMGCWPYYFNGIMDDFRFYNRGLTFDEINFLAGLSTQTITGFNPPSNTPYGSIFSFNATSSSGLPITYSSSNNSIVGISGNLATATGIGVVTLTAMQVGNVSVAGTSLTSVLTVTKANLTVRVNNAYRLYSYNNPTFTSSISGLAFNDNVISSYYTSATSSSGVGFYTIYPIITTNSPLKYNITTLTGTLEIGLPTITVTSPPVTVTSVITVTSQPVTITSVITVTSPPVTVTSINTITVTSPPVTVTGNCPMVTVQGVSLLTEVQSIYPNASIYIYPNPTSGNLTISATNVTVSWIEVYNSAGILVQTQAGTSINISAQPAGIYSIWLKDSQNRYLAGQKISKQ
jgi:hypothetical protein